jgi:hypothetical protein
VLLTDQLYYVNFASAAQDRAPDQFRGRVGAAIRVLTAGVGVPAGAFLGGVLAGAIGLRPTAVLARLGVVVACLWLVLSPVRSLRSLADDTGARARGAEPGAGQAHPDGTGGAPAPRRPLSGAV